jgi:predicted Zn-dependent protease
VREVEDRFEHLLVRRGITHPIETGHDRGAMVTVWRRSGVGYCATADLSAASLQQAADTADQWAALAERCGVFDGVDLHALLEATPTAQHPAIESAAAIEPLPPRSALIDLLRAESAAMHLDDRSASR